MPHFGEARGLAHYLYEVPPFCAQVWQREVQGVQVIGTIGRVFIQAIMVKTPMTVSGIVVQHGAVAGGNFRVALYGPDTKTPPAAAATPLLAESASTACNGINRSQHVPFTVGNIQLQPGMYWIAIQADNITDDYTWINRNVYEITGDHFDHMRYFANAGGYGAFQDPVPATTTVDRGFGTWLRVVSIP